MASMLAICGEGRNESSSPSLIVSLERMEGQSPTERETSPEFSEFPQGQRGHGGLCAGCLVTVLRGNHGLLAVFDQFVDMGVEALRAPIVR